MSQGAALPEDFASNPGWFMLDYSLPHRKFIFTALQELQFAEASFLDARLQLRPEQLQGVPLADVEAAFPTAFEQAPAAYIFQIGHCGSTLLSRTLGATPDVLALREPLPLKVLAGAELELGEPLSWVNADEWSRLKTLILQALERRFRPDQLPIVKANSTCNSLIGPVLETHADRRAVLLYQSLESSLAGLFRNPANFGDLRIQGRDRLQEWQSLTGTKEPVLSELDEEDIATISWIASLQRFEQARQQYPDQVLMLEFNDFLAAPADHLTRIACFFGLESQADQLVERFARVSSVYAKDPSQAYSAEIRQSKLDQSRRHNADAIRRCMKKAQAMLRAHPGLSHLDRHFGGR